MCTHRGIQPTAYTTDTYDCPEQPPEKPTFRPMSAEAWPEEKGCYPLRDLLRHKIDRNFLILMMQCSVIH